MKFSSIIITMIVATILFAFPTNASITVINTTPVSVSSTMMIFNNNTTTTIPAAAVPTPFFNNATMISSAEPATKTINIKPEAIINQSLMAIITIISITLLAYVTFMDWAMENPIAALALSLVFYYYYLNNNNNESSSNDLTDTNMNAAEDDNDDCNSERVIIEDTTTTPTTTTNNNIFSNMAATSTNNNINIYCQVIEGNSESFFDNKINNNNDEDCAGCSDCMQLREMQSTTTTTTTTMTPEEQEEAEKQAAYEKAAAEFKETFNQAFLEEYGYEFTGSQEDWDLLDKDFGYDYVPQLTSRSTWGQ